MFYKDLLKNNTINHNYNFKFNTKAYVGEVKVSDHIADMNIDKKSTAKNVVLIIFVDKTNILIVTEKYGQVGFPAGKLERKIIDDPKTDVPEIKRYEYESEIEGMIREYEEESGNKFPNIQIVKKIVYRKHTAIFIAIANDTIETKLGEHNDKEIISMQLVDIKTIKLAIDDKYPSLPFRTCAKFSTKCVFAYLGI